jgi:hypothetical protein
MQWVTNTIDANGESVSLSAEPGIMEISITGTWSGTLELRHYRSDSDYILANTYTSNPSSVIQIDTPRGQGFYRVVATAWTSGTATVKLGNV